MTFFLFFSGPVKGDIAIEDLHMAHYFVVIEDFNNLLNDEDIILFPYGMEYPSSFEYDDDICILNRDQRTLKVVVKDSDVIASLVSHMFIKRGIWNILDYSGLFWRNLDCSGGIRRNLEKSGWFWIVLD